MSRRLLTTALIMVVALAVILVGWPAGMPASAVEVVSDLVSARLVQDQDHSLGEVCLNQQVVLRIRAPLGCYDVAERTSIVADRLRDMLRDGIEPYQFGLDYVEGALALTAAGQPLVTVDRATAARAGGSPLTTAVIWLKNLRQALGWDPLTLASRSTLTSRDARDWTGLASWYGPGFQGRRTASGECFDMNGYTAAHRTLPFGTQLLVTSLDTGLATLVRINDRGPFVRGREIDLSRAAAAAIGLLAYGTGPVSIDVIR